MTLNEYISLLPSGGATRFAKQIKVSRSRLSQMVSGITAIPAHKATAIRDATNGLVSRKESRPDDWSDYWPEDANITPIMKGSLINEYQPR